MIPLKDNIPTERFALVTLVLIAINVAVFAWQFTRSEEPDSSTSPQVNGLSQADEATLELGAIPYRLTHPGRDCGVVTARQGVQPDLDEPIACEGSSAEREARAQPGVNVVPLDAPPWWVTILTSMFMHGGILHLAGNMLFLWVFGNNIEDSMGRARFVLFYLLAGIAAVYAHTLLDPDSAVPTIGASGAVSGVLGAYILLHPRARVLTLVFLIFIITFVEIPAMVMLGIWFVLQFLPVVGQLSSPEVIGEGGVAYLAHVGGFVFGLAAIKLFADRARQRDGPTPPYPVY